MSKGPTAKHTNCRRGTRVFIKLRDGERLVDIFIERKGGYLFFKNIGRVSKAAIESFAVYKERQPHS